MNINLEIDAVSERIRREITAMRREGEFPESLVRAVVAAEDRRFFRHRGIDLSAIIRALWKFLTSRTLSGASTIEQQLVRTLRGRYEISLNRKLSEIAIAIAISRKFDKRVIANVYCNVAYLGWRATGMKQAASRLGLDIFALSEREAATLAAMLKLPMPKQPNKAYSNRLQRRILYIVNRANQKEWVK
jgi:penicillin-binding protein 1A